MVLIGLDSDFLGHLVPCCELGGNDFRELFRAVADRIHALRSELLRDVLGPRCLDGLRMQFINYRLWNAGWRGHAPLACKLVTGNAAFRNGGHFGRSTPAREAGDAKGAQPVRFDVRHDFERAGETEVHFTADYAHSMSGESRV